jgi:hypothetical protein
MSGIWARKFDDPKDLKKNHNQIIIVLNGTFREKTYFEKLNEVTSMGRCSSGFSNQ